MTDLQTLAAAADRRVAPALAHIDEVASARTAGVLAAFAAERVAAADFSGTTGYGYDDTGRDKLERIFARVMGGERALVRTTFVNGTHAIACGMFACVRSGETLLSLTGEVYDTLQTVVGQHGAIGGTFADYGIGFAAVPLRDGRPDADAIRAAVRDPRVTACYIQRSRGYGDRVTLSSAEIGALCALVREERPGMTVMADNCYGEFCDTDEPLHHGVDLICGSLIKNPGGGVAPMGGYICGRADLIERAAARMTVPGIGGECGASLDVNRLLYQGLFLAPHVTAQALKTAAFAAACMEELGYQVSPGSDEIRHDIIQVLRFGEPEPLLRFVRGIQAGAPVDSFARPEPWPMPGYDDPVVMAAGAFIQGSSIELSCDAPMRAPYLAYLQGGLTYESGRLGVLRGVRELMGW